MYQITHCGQCARELRYIAGQRIPDSVVCTGCMKTSVVSKEDTAVLQENNAPAMFWAMAFGHKVDAVEGAYHAWQLNIITRQRNNNPEKRDELQAKAQSAREHYNAARAELFAWVVAHPAPEGTTNL